jgi:DNA-binding transcriptional MerR regulator
MTTATLTIQAAARDSELTPGTLRLYERLGLLKPRRDSTGRRLYGPADIVRAREIKKKRLAARGSGLRNYKNGLRAMDAVRKTAFKVESQPRAREEALCPDHAASNRTSSK